MNPTHKFSKVLFCIRDFQITLKSGLSLAKSSVLRYQLENKSIRPTLINFFSKCINRENHQPFDHSLSLSLSLSIYIYIYILQKKLVNQPLLFVKVRNNKRKGSVISNKLGIFSQGKKTFLFYLPTYLTHPPTISLSFSLFY